MGISVKRIEKAQEELFARLEDDLALANGKEYLMGKDMYYYTMAMRNLEELKKTAAVE